MDWSSLVPDEVSFAGPEHLDPDYVAAYEHKAGFDPAEEVALLRGRGLGSESTLVDLGGGTGILALAAAPHCRRVIVVDVSAQMIAAAKRKADRLGLDNVECVRAGFLGYVHEGSAPEFVYSRNALHHLPELWKAVALERIAGMLRPGGYFRLRDIAFGFELSESMRFIGAWLDAAAERTEDGWTRGELETHLREEHSTFTWLLEPMLEQAGFAIEHADYGSQRIHASYICLKT